MNFERQEYLNSEVSPIKSTDGAKSNKKVDLTALFSIVLREQLKIYYRGELPSCAKIARDFSARAPHLQSISSETVRKWLTGAALPHSARMAVLIEWLGKELESTFNPATFLAKTRGLNGLSTTAESMPPLLTATELIKFYSTLSQRDKQTISTLMRSLSAVKSSAGGG